MKLMLNIDYHLQLIDYLIRWHPKSGTDIHKHNGKKCDYIMIWVLYKKLDLIVII